MRRCARLAGPAAVAALALATATTAPAVSRHATAAPLAASFDSRSYRPGQTALLRIESAGAVHAWLQVFQAGAEAAPDSVSAAHDIPTTGVPVTKAVEIRRAPGGASTVAVHVGDWPSGVYAARLVSSDGSRAYAPFVLRPTRLGQVRVLVVEPTNTWEAYNFWAGDSWYENPAVHVVDLGRPYLGDLGLPKSFRSVDLGFLRWYWRFGHHAEFLSDDDLEQFVSGRQLRGMYDLVVFAGHEEYVTSHVYDVIEQYRDDGGNLAFLSADNFFYEVTRSGSDIVGRTRWRDLGRPEAQLVGAQYEGWEAHVFPNRPFVVTGAERAPWLFAGTGLHDGSSFGRYGIEIDGLSAASPPGTAVLAQIPNDFGPGVSAEMTYYQRDGAKVFDAGVLNFAPTADWPGVSRLMENLWRHLAPPGA
jgi:hypothetical protein